MTKKAKGKARARTKAETKTKPKPETKAETKNKRPAKKAATTTTTTTTTTTSSSSTSTSSSTDKRPVDLAEVRKDIANIVGSSAADLARAVVETGRTGQLAPVKYLFEAIGLYPASESSETKPDQESLAHTLMRSLKLPESPVADEDDEDATPATPSAAVQGAGEQGPVKQEGSADSGTGGSAEHSHGEQSTTAEGAGTIP